MKKLICVILILLCFSALCEEPVILRISAAGDCTLGGDVNGSDKGLKKFDGIFRENGAKWFLKNVRPVFEADDLTIVNFEGTIPNASDKCKNSGFNFMGYPEYTDILTSASVEVCTIANNHSADFGSSGIRSTIDHLHEAGLGVCGYGSIYSAEIKGVKVIVCGFTWWQDRVECVTAVKNLRKSCDLLIVYMHWGSEKYYDVEKNQSWWGHSLIDAGADLVLGSHTHLVSGIEQYKGKYIVYSLGNFCFGGNVNPSDYDTFIFVQEFVITDGNVEDGGIQIVPCLLSSESGINNFQPVLAESYDAIRVTNKVQKYSKTYWGYMKWLD